MWGSVKGCTGPEEKQQGSGPGTEGTREGRLEMTLEWIKKQIMGESHDDHCGDTVGRHHYCCISCLSTHGSAG